MGYPSPRLRGLSCRALPEVIAGYPRESDQGPVPRAWAAATPLAMLTAVRAGRTVA